MCFSPCFLQATQGAFVQRRLLQCRTCGSQAFHVLDCCRNPDYVHVPTSHLGKTLRDWLGRVQAMVHSRLLQRHRRAEPRMSPDALDAWEARPITVINAGDAGARRDIGADKASQDAEHDAVSAYR